MGSAQQGGDGVKTRRFDKTRVHPLRRMSESRFVVNAARIVSESDGSKGVIVHMNERMDKTRRHSVENELSTNKETEIGSRENYGAAFVE